MKQIFLTISLALALTGPALAAPGQEPRQDQPRQDQPRQTSHRGDYWLSRDMQKLVFWEPRDRAVQDPATASH